MLDSKSFLLAGVYSGQMKHCPRCDSDLPTNKFSVNNARYDKLQPYCSDCMKRYRKEHYDSAKQPYLDRARKTTAAIKELVREAKNKPCMDCGISYPYYVMDLDHRDPLEKLFTPAKLATSGSIRKAKEEIEKCDAVCSNCHRMRTHG